VRREPSHSPRRLERTAATGTRPGLRPSVGFGQPAPPWAGLLLDRTRPLPWPIASGSEGMGRGELNRTGAGAQLAARADYEVRQEELNIDQAGGNGDPRGLTRLSRREHGGSFEIRPSMSGERVEPDGFIPPPGGMQDVALIIVTGIKDNRTTIVLWRIRKGSRSPRDRGEGTTKVWMGCSRRADSKAAGQEREQQPVCGETRCDRACQATRSQPVNEARSILKTGRPARWFQGTWNLNPVP
jgi:hypothetical protein